MERQRPAQIAELRRLIRHVLSPTDPADAMASYYALWHDPHRTQLTIHRDSQGRVDGYVAVSQTGADLFRPLVTYRAPSEGVAAEMLISTLSPSRTYLIVAPLASASDLRATLELSRDSVEIIYGLSPSRFQPVINVLVQRTTGADGSVRYQIESRGTLAAMAGTNWRSPSFAEVFVYVHPTGRGRGWGKSVVSACTAALLEDRIRPLYVVRPDSTASARTAESLGYVDTGIRQLAAEARLRSDT